MLTIIFEKDDDTNRMWRFKIFKESSFFRPTLLKQSEKYVGLLFGHPDENSEINKTSDQVIE